MRYLIFSFGDDKRFTLMVLKLFINKFQFERNMATSGGRRRDDGSDNSDDELTPLNQEIYGGR